MRQAGEEGGQRRAGSPGHGKWEFLAAHQENVLRASPCEATRPPTMLGVVVSPWRPAAGVIRGECWGNWRGWGNRRLSPMAIWLVPKGRGEFVLCALFLWEEETAEGAAPGFCWAALGGLSPPGWSRGPGSRPPVQWLCVGSSCPSLQPGKGQLDSDLETSSRAWVHSRPPPPWGLPCARSLLPSAQHCASLYHPAQC